jgi:hypothetical protein
VWLVFDNREEEKGEPMGLLALGRQSSRETGGGA